MDQHIELVSSGVVWELSVGGVCTLSSTDSSSAPVPYWRMHALDGNWINVAEAIGKQVATSTERVISA